MANDFQVVRRQSIYVTEVKLDEVKSTLFRYFNFNFNH